MTGFAVLADRARALRRELVALALAVRHPSTPWYGPVIGFIDDLIFIPLAIALAVRFIPAPVIGAAWVATLALIAVWTVR